MTEKIDVVDALAGLAEDLRSHGNFVDRISDAVAAMKKERDAALAEIERLRTDVDRFQWANEMGCEHTPNPACQCPGCETARERADRGETGP